MPFNINEFKSNGARYGFTRPAFFMAAFQPPRNAWYGKDLRWLSFLCSAATLPGVRLITSDVKPSGYGVTQKVPFDVMHSDLTLTFYCDGEGKIVSFFDQWLRNTVSYGSSSGTFTGAFQGEVQYPGNYQTMFNLFQYNDAPGATGQIGGIIGGIEGLASGGVSGLIKTLKGNGRSATDIAQGALLQYTFDQLYPISMGEVTTDWSNGDSIQTLQVEFAFRNFKIQKNTVTAFGVLENTGYYDSISGNGGSDVARLFGSTGIVSGVIGVANIINNALSTISTLETSIKDSISTVGSLAKDISSVGGIAKLAGTSLPTISGLHI